MPSKQLKVGFIGAGYISDWHAQALSQHSAASLVAVCDTNYANSTSFATRYGVTPYSCVDDMLEREALDVVHVLSPPGLHCEHALAALKKACHVFVEKPFALNAQDARKMVSTSQEMAKILAVNHNFTALPSYVRLKKLIEEGLIGRINSAELHWNYPLSPLRSGPFGLWMLRQQENILFELGPHLFAFAADLLGPLQDLYLRPSKPIDVPGLGTRYQNWTILARAGAVDVTLSISLVEGVEDRSLTLRGVSGVAHFDYGADTLILRRGNAHEIVINPLSSASSVGFQYLKEGLRNAVKQGASLNKASPYAISFRDAIAQFYNAATEGQSLCKSLSSETALTVVEQIEQLVPQIPKIDIETSAESRCSTEEMIKAKRDTVIVVGGTGFIGRALTRALVAKGYHVKILSRGRSTLFVDLGNAVDVLPVDLKNVESMSEAMNGAVAVYHLARSEEKSWAAYLENDVKVTECIGAAALLAKVKRFVYTGTIASYDASNPSKTIDESTPFGPMEKRGLYGRSKALCEERLIASMKSEGLPLVIARPGIVIGQGGPLQHWGIGHWNGSSAVKLWGEGENKLPFVLIDDVADGLIRLIQHDGLVGQSFNLVGDPLLSAQDYFEAIFQITGTRIRVTRGSLFLMYCTDWIKYILKRYVSGRHDALKPSRADCWSRAHLSIFSNQRSISILGWRPCNNREELTSRAIDHRQFFGF